MSITTRCALCNRPLRLAAASINSRRGPMLFGPVCARRQGLTLRAAKKRRTAAVRIAGRRDPNQLNLPLAGGGSK